MNIIKKMGYESLFDSREKFYKIKEEKIGKYLFGFHIIIEDGTIDFVWNVWEDEKLILGSPWGIYSRLLINPEYKIKRPVIGSYEDIEEILNVALKCMKNLKIH